MLKPAILYKTEIDKAMSSLFYTDAMFYETGSVEDNWVPSIGDGCPGKFDWAIVDDNDKLIGFISYTIDFYISSARNFGLISFDIGNPLIGLALRQILNDFQKKYHLHRLEWRMVGGNPVEKHYDKLCKKFNGRKLYLHDAIRDNDGNYRAVIIYEIILPEGD